MHFKLSEIQQLIYQIQQTFRISLDQLKLLLLHCVFGLLDHFLQWRKDECERCSELMAHICEEFDLHHIKLMHANGLLTLLYTLKFEALALLDQLTRDQQTTDHKKAIEDKCSSCFPKWR